MPIPYTAASVKDEMIARLQAKQVDEALQLFTSHHTEVEKAICEYDPMQHKVMTRRDIYPKGGEPIRREKLPRTRQRYINEVELFFLLGNPVEWTKLDGSEEAFTLFTDYLRDIRLDGLLRQCKRLAGAETECALMFLPYGKDGRLDFHRFVVARSLGYDLRTLFDQYGNLLAIAYGYALDEGGNAPVLHWDIHTAEQITLVRRAESGWQIQSFANPAGKILGVYFRQPKAWDGVEHRLDREEDLDSKVGDENNYFANPIAAVSADVVDSMVHGESVAKMIQLAGPSSRFEYINPPTSSETRRDEMQSLERSILFDTFTPDLSFESLKGWGTVSGAAIRNSMTLGYIKRSCRIELYGPLVDRLKNVILAILRQLHPERAQQLEGLKIGFQFAEPFAAEAPLPEKEEVSPIPVVGE